MKLTRIIPASLVFLGVLTCNIFALPGVEQSVKDTSGQYVYYKDSSFERESYIGIITYDDETYGLRYYAPADLSSNPAKNTKDITVLLTVDPTKNYPEFTGERIIGNYTGEDSIIINYLHDIFYEFCSRRHKAGLITVNTSVKEDYNQFGGLVEIFYNPLIPLFNIEKIISPDNTPLFKLITSGQLISSNDESFSSFTGIPVKITDSVHSFKPSKKAEKTKYTVSMEGFPNQQITLDSQWTQSMDNLWTLDKQAILVINVISGKDIKDDFYSLLQRKVIIGTQDSYPLYDMLDFKTDAKGDRTETKSVFYNPLSGSFTKDYKILTKLGDDSVAFLSLTVFYGSYSENVKYFEDILKSYKISR